MQSMKVGDSYSKNTPFPFKAKGILLHHANTSEFIAHSFAGDPPEVAVIGRSNVGKSTLVNALVGFDTSFVQKSAMSDKPGETKQLAFYQIGSVHPKYDELENVPSSAQSGLLLGHQAGQAQLGTGANKLAITGGGKGALVKSNGVGEAVFQRPVIHQQKPKTPALVLVDMPGYGFSYSKESDKERMHNLCVDYLMSNMPRDNRDAALREFGDESEEAAVTATAATSDKTDEKRKKPLKRVLLLVDARHGLKFADVTFFNTLYETIAKEFHYLKEAVLSPEEVARLKRRKNYINTNTPSTTNVVMTDEMIESLRMEKFHKRLARMMHWKLQIVVTKCDLLERTELCRRIMVERANIESKLNPIFHNNLPLVVLSGKQKRGLLDLQNELSGLVPDAEANRLSEKEKRWLLIREQREKEYLKRLRLEKKESRENKLLEEKREQRKKRKAAAAAEREAQRQTDKDLAALAAAVEEQREAAGFVAPAHGGVFRTRSADVPPNADVHGEREKVPRTPSPRSPTAHLTPQEYAFRLHHERPLHPSKVEREQREEEEGEVGGVDPSERDAESVLISDEEWRRMHAASNKIEDAATAASDSNGSDEVVSFKKVDFKKAGSESTMNHALKSPVAKAAVNSNNKTSSSKKRDSEAASGSRGRRQSRPLVTRVGGVTTFAEVAQPYGQVVGAVGAKTIVNSNKRSAARTEKKKEQQQQEEEKEEVDPIAAAMLRKAEEVKQRNREEKQKKSSGKQSSDVKEKQMLEKQEVMPVALKNEKQQQQRQQTPVTSVTAPTTAPPTTSAAPRKQVALSNEEEYFQSLESDAREREGRAAVRGRGATGRESAAPRRRQQQQKRDVDDDDELEAGDNEGEYDSDNMYEEVGEEEEEREAREKKKSDKKKEVKGERLGERQRGTPDKRDTSKQTVTSSSTSASASGVISSSTKRYDLTQHNSRLANSTPYTDEELYKHAYTEGFTTSAYDEDVRVDGRQTRLIRDPVSGVVVKAVKMNRKQKRAKRRAREEAIKAGTLYE